LDGAKSNDEDAKNNGDGGLFDIDHGTKNAGLSGAHDHA